MCSMFLHKTFVPRLVSPNVSKYIHRPPPLSDEYPNKQTVSLNHHRIFFKANRWQQVIAVAPVRRGMMVAVHFLPATDDALDVKFQLGNETYRQCLISFTRAFPPNIFSKSYPVRFRHFSRKKFSISNLQIVIRLLRHEKGLILPRFLFSLYPVRPRCCRSRSKLRSLFVNPIIFRSGIFINGDRVPGQRSAPQSP